MLLVQVHPDDLRPNGWNSNVVSPENEAKLDAMIERHGFFKPVIVRRVPGTVPELEILGGEHRWGSARRLGLLQIPVMNLDEISDEKAKEISLADNARYGSDDALLLAEVMKGLDTYFDVTAFLPYSDADVKSIWSSSTIDLSDITIDENFDAEEPAAEEPAPVRAPKTHSIIRFKLSNRDAENVNSLLAKVMRRHGLNEPDALLNAGDALIHILGEAFADAASEAA